MDYDEAVAAIESLAASEVDVSVWGLGEDASPLIDVSGVLSRMPAVDLPTDLAGAEVAVTFCVEGQPGFAQVSVWRSRFVSAARDSEDVIEMKTLDGLLRIGRHKRPWID